MSTPPIPPTTGIRDNTSQDRFSDMDPKHAVILRAGQRFAAEYGQDLHKKQKERFRITLEPLEAELEVRVEAYGRHVRRALKWSQLEGGGHPFLQNAIRITAARLIPIQLVGSAADKE